ncbi:Uncharacterised protein [Vibrio cholerae]|nr:Uncharacterised protein [Vibrio cholerae]CSI89550.1 Uncharacterised protein [Vibrio cholerae]
MAISRNTSSPAACPKVSFTCLKPSKSINSSTIVVLARCLRSTNFSQPKRFFSPVSVSCSAMVR